jgi:hypothetical protein
MTHDSQLSQIRRHLLTRGSITPLDALRDYGCMRLGGRIYELRELWGKDSIVTTVPPEGKRYAIYTYTGPQQMALFGEAV